MDERIMIPYTITSPLSSDFESVYEMLLRYREERPEASLVPLTRTGTKSSFDMCLDNRLSLIRVVTAVDHEENSNLLGILWAVAQPSTFSGQLIASTVLFRVEPELSGTRASKDLLESYEEWVRELGAIGTIACFDTRTGKLFERRGYKLGELLYLIPTDQPEQPEQID